MENNLPKLSYTEKQKKNSKIGMYFGLALIVLLVAGLFVFMTNFSGEEKEVSVRVVDSETNKVIREVVLEEPQYKNKDLDVTFRDKELRENLLDLQLKSHSSVDEVKRFLPGKRVVMWYDINSNYLLENALEEPEFVDKKTGELVDIEWRYVYWGEEEYEHNIVGEIISENGTISSGVIGKETRKRKTWLPYNSKDVPKGKIRLGIQVEVGWDDHIDGVWNVGGKKIDKHAQWGSLDFGSWQNSKIFNTTGATTWSVPADIDATAGVEVLVVAGGGGGGGRIGGGGGSDGSGGGGAGGFIHNQSYNNITAGATINIHVGRGGSGSGGIGGTGENGTFSEFGTSAFIHNATGGGGGGLRVEGGNGGSGGGGSADGGTTWAGGSGVVGQGNDGNDGASSSVGGGGGGAGATNATTQHGGKGKFAFGLEWACGGGGGTNAATGGSGGCDSAGDGGTSGTGSDPTNAENFTGSGGGGNGGNDAISAGDGGEGVVIVAWNATQGLGVTLTSPTDGTNFTANNLNFTATVSDSGGIGITNVSLIINGSIVVTNTSGFATNYTFHYTAPEGDFHTWTVNAWDANADPDIHTATNGTAEFSVNTKPDVRLENPLDGVNLTNPTILFNATVISHFDITNVSIFINGSLAESNTSGLSGNYTFDITVPDGSHNWSIEASSSNGNATNSTGTRTFNINSKPDVTLNSPADAITTSDTTITFNATVISNHDIANVSLFVNGTFNESNTSGISGFYTFTKTFEVGKFNWSIEASSSNGNATNSSATRSFVVEPFTNFNEIFNGSVFETSRQGFYLYLNTSSAYNVQDGRLVYNGTSHSLAQETDLGGGNFILSHEINIPVGTELGFEFQNKTFFWNITMIETDTGDTFFATTDVQQQNVSEIVFGNCGVGRDLDILNFTMLDEGTSTEINAVANPSTFQATFNLGADYNYKVRNVSINNQTTSLSEFDFCTDHLNQTLYVDMEALFSAENYVEKNYILSNASLTNTTTEIDLFMLNESDALEFFNTVLEGLEPVGNAVVTTAKFFIGEGVYKTVEIDTTNDDDGTFTAYLELDRKYRFSIVDSSGDFRGTIEKTASCDVAPCELTILIEGTGITDTLFADNFATGVLYNVSYNPLTKLVEFEFVDTTGVATSFRMVIKESSLNETGQVIFDKESFTSSGTITANMSNFTEGDFTVETYISRSPYQFIDYYYFTISEVTEQLGILGLFSALMIILVVIFGLAYSPALLVLSVPLALTTTKLMGIISVSWGFIVLVYVLTFIAIISLNR